MVYSGYCTIDQIKERCLISLVDHTRDTQLEECGTEASRQVDELIRPYLTERLVVTLSGYTNCIASDIGKEVLDDGVKIGTLLDYDNNDQQWWIKSTSVIFFIWDPGGWWIKSSSVIANGSSLEIFHGVGEGVGGASTDDVTEQENPYFIFKILPLSAVIPDQITFITADFAAAIFLRRYMPAKYSEEWWTVALGKMEEFIRSNWYKGAFQFT